MLLVTGFYLLLMGVGVYKGWFMIIIVISPWIIIEIIVVVPKLVFSTALVLPHGERFLCHHCIGNIILASSSVLPSSFFHIVNDACLLFNILLPEALLDCTGELGTQCHRRASPASGSRHTPRRMEHTQSSTPENAFR